MDDNGLGHEHMAPVLSRRTNNPTGGKGMKIARAAKRLAMLITVVALAVVTMACQGAVGPQGDQGPKGDKGDQGEAGNTGATGPAGIPGTAPLTVYGDIKSILVNDGDLPAGETVIPWGPAGTVSAADSYFRGGYAPVKYALVAPMTDMHGATAENAEDSYAAETDSVGTSRFKITISDGVVSYEARDGEEAAADEQYTRGTTFHVRATDDIKASAITPVISVKRNRAPRARTGNAFAEQFVGTQSGFVYPGGVTTDAQRAEYREDPCNNIMNACVTIGTDASGQFEDEDPGDLTFMVVSDDPTLVSASVDGTKIQVTGLMATDDVDEADAAARDPAQVKVSAIDRGGLATPAAAVRTLLVNVDPEPKAEGRLNNGELLKLETGEGNKNSEVIDVSTYFTDTSRSAVTLEYSVSVDGKDTPAEERPNIVDYTITGSSLTITAVATGNVAVVVKVTESGGTPVLGQSATQELSVRVN